MTLPELSLDRVLGPLRERTRLARWQLDQEPLGADCPAPPAQFAVPRISLPALVPISAPQTTILSGATAAWASTGLTTRTEHRTAPIIQPSPRQTSPRLPGSCSLLLFRYGSAGNSVHGEPSLTRLRARVSEIEQEPTSITPACSRPGRKPTPHTPPDEWVQIHVDRVAEKLTA